MKKGNWIWLVAAALFLGSAINVGFKLSVDTGEAALLFLLAVVFAYIAFRRNKES